jgi:hypothetical protein
MPSARKIDANGFLTIKGCPITSFGIFDYSAGQLGLPGDPKRIVKVYRPESTVRDPAAIESFKNVPMIDDHEMLSGFKGDKENTAPEEYGVSGILTSDVYYDEPWMRGDLKIFARDMQELLNAGKKDLSLGYSCDFEIKPGVFDGQPYEVVQLNMRGNHIALVEAGRVPGARVLDGLCFDHLSFDALPSDKERAMKLKSKAFDNAVEQLKALLPALQQFLNEEATEPAHQEAGAGEGAEAAQNVNGVNMANGGEAQGAEKGQIDQGGVEENSMNAGNEAGQEVAGGEDGKADLGQLVSEVEAVLAKIKAAMGGGEGVNGKEKSGEQAADNVEGLATQSSHEGAAPAVDDQMGATDTEAQSQAMGGAKAEDAAVQRFYADLAAKDRIYNRLSAVVGAFDHKAMDARQVVAYGVKKLGLKCADGAETATLEGYLTGVEKAKSDTKQRALAGTATDSAARAPEVDAWLN